MLVLIEIAYFSDMIVNTPILFTLKYATRLWKLQLSAKMEFYLIWTTVFLRLRFCALYMILNCLGYITLLLYFHCLLNLFMHLIELHPSACSSTCLCYVRIVNNNMLCKHRHRVFPKWITWSECHFFYYYYIRILNHFRKKGQAIEFMTYLQGSCNDFNLGAIHNQQPPFFKM